MGTIYNTEVLNLLKHKNIVPIYKLHIKIGTFIDGFIFEDKRGKKYNSI